MSTVEATLHGDNAPLRSHRLPNKEPSASYKHLLPTVADPSDLETSKTIQVIAIALDIT